MKVRTIVTFILSLIVFGVVFFYGSSLLDILNLSSNDTVDGEDLAHGNEIQQRVPNEILFLMVGVDENSQMEDKSANTRTDTIMLVKANFQEGSAEVVSIPRDTKVIINGEYHKINAAHAYGGMVLTLQTIRNFLGIDLDYYVMVDFKAVEEIVDAMGGITVYNANRIVIPQEEVDIPAGEVHLNGKDALAFVRNRQFDDGDLGRVNNQQQFLLTLLDQIISPSNITKAPKILSVIRKEVKTNIPADIMADGATKVANINRDKIRFQTIPGSIVNQGTSFYVADKEGTLQLIDDHFSDYKLTQQEIEREKEQEVDADTFNNPEINQEMEWQNQY